MSKEKKEKRKKMPKKYFIRRNSSNSNLYIVNPLDDIAAFVEHSYGVSKGTAYRTILEPKLL